MSPKKDNFVSKHVFGDKVVVFWRHFFFGDILVLFFSSGLFARLCYIHDIVSHGCSNVFENWAYIFYTSNKIADQLHGLIEVIGRNFLHGIPANKPTLQPAFSLHPRNNEGFLEHSNPLRYSSGS